MVSLNNNTPVYVLCSISPSLSAHQEIKRLSSSISNESSKDKYLTRRREVLKKTGVIIETIALLFLLIVIRKNDSLNVKAFCLIARSD